MHIMDKKRNNRAIQPEEFHTLTDFVKMAERRLLAFREAGRTERRSAMEMVRSLVPGRAFQMEIAELELDDDINKALSRIDNVGELMVRMLADEEALGRLLKAGGAGDDAMEAIRYALDDLVILGPEPEAAAAAEVEEAAPEAELVEAASEVAAPAAAEVVEVVPQPSEDEAAMEYSFDENEPAPAPIKPPRIPQPAVIEEPEVPALVAPVEEDDAASQAQGGPSRRTGI